MKKRIASVLVALVMVLSLVPKTSWAWTSTVTTLEQLKSAMSELSYNNTIEIVVSGTIEISETLNIRPTRTTNGSMAWYEYYSQRVVISGADANSKLVRAEGFKGSLFNLMGEQGYSGAGGSDHPAYAALTLKDITVDGGGDKTAATNPAIYVSRYGTLTLDDGAVLRNCKSQYYAGGAVGLFAGTSEFVMNGTARMEDNEADYGGGVYVANILAAFTMNGGTIANNTATKYGGVYCEANKQYGSEDTAKINLNGGTITGNTAGIAGGGVYFGGMTTCKVAGTVNITGNTQGDDKAASNLHVAASAEDQAVLAGNVSSDSRIGLNADLIPTYRIVRGSSDTNVFTSDRANCAVTKNGSVSFNLDLLANEEHIHCVCLQNQSYGPYHDHDKDTKWVGISSLKSVKSYGCYYLLNDVTTTDEGWGSDLDDVQICLNGHNIILENGYYRPYIHVTNYHTLTITDCAEEAGQITRKDTADPKGTRIIEIDAGCKFNMFGGEITGSRVNSTNDDLGFDGGGVFARGYDHTITLSGRSIIQNNVDKDNQDNNLYLENSSQQVSARRLSSGADIGISSGRTLASGQTVQISSDACTGSIQYVSADRAGYETYLNSEGLIYLRLKTYQVSVTLPNGLTYKNGGQLTQDCLDLTPITISVTDPDNYYIPDGYSVTLNGITAAKVDSYTIRVTGTATADTAMTLTAPTEKTAQTQPPTGLTVTHPQSRTGYGRINGTNSSMEYRPVGGTSWSQCGSAFTSALAGTYEVRYAATEPRKPSPSTTVTLNQYLEAIPVPTVYGPFTYNGNWQYGLLPGEVYGYELVGSGYRACRVGTYTVTVRPAAGFKWSDGTTGEKKLQWEIVKRTPTAGDFTFTAPENLEYDGTAKEATVRWSTGGDRTMGMGYWPDNTFTVIYKQNGKVVAAPTDMGTYQVYVTVPGNEDINAVSELTDPSWTFTITHTGNHQWGDWRHDDTQHWRSCAVPGCQLKDSLGSHDGTATCTERATCSICGAAYDTTDPNHHDLTHHDGTAATCTQPGSLEYWQCSDCHKLFADAAAAQPITDTVIPATHHANARRTAGDPATCTQDGCAAYWYCPDCGSYFADADGKLDESETYTGPEDFYQEAMGHSFTHYVYDNNATYDDDGTETAQCDHGCGLTDTRTKVGSKLIDKAAPAVEGVTDGGTYCLTAEITVTDPNLESVTLNGQPVELVDGKLTVSAAEDVQTLTATDCFGNTVTVTFTVNAQHTEGEVKITTPATTEREGVKTYACTVCGQVLRTESVTKLPAPAEPTTPAVPTGDTGLWMGLAALCGMSLAALLRTGKRKEQ